MKCPTHGCESVLHTSRKKTWGIRRYYKCPNGCNFKVDLTENVLPPTVRPTANVLPNPAPTPTEVYSNAAEIDELEQEMLSYAERTRPPELLPPITKEQVEQERWTAGRWLQEWLRRNYLPEGWPCPAPPPGLDMSDWPKHIKFDADPVDAKELGF